MEGRKRGFYESYMKRLLDIVLSLLAILVLGLPIVIFAFLIKIKLGNPVLFKQKRPGLNETIFTIYKFRTMTDERDADGKLLPDSHRLTQFGKFLRSTSFDEIPELLNILKGDMSIVGPRPQLVKDMVFMDSQQRRRHSVLPGLTGWAQINGRNELSWEKKLDLDNEYLDNITCYTDCKIIFLTVLIVFKREGISNKEMATAEDFGDYLLREKKINSDKYFAILKESDQLQR